MSKLVWIGGAAAIVIVPALAGYAYVKHLNSGGGYAISLSTGDTAPQPGDLIAGSMIASQPNSVTLSNGASLYSPFDGTVIADANNDYCTFLTSATLEQVGNAQIPSPVFRICGEFNPPYGEYFKGESIAPAGTVSVSRLMAAPDVAAEPWLSFPPSRGEIESLLSQSSLPAQPEPSDRENPPSQILENAPADNILSRKILDDGEESQLASRSVSPTSDLVYQADVPEGMGMELDKILVKNPQHLCSEDSIVQRGNPGDRHQSTIAVLVTANGVATPANLTVLCESIGPNQFLRQPALFGNIVYEDGCRTPTTVYIDGSVDRIDEVKASSEDSNCFWGERSTIVFEVNS